MTVPEMKKPINESYWVVPGKFLAGEFPGDFDIRYSRVKIESLKEAGITSFIDLTEKDEGLSPYFPELEDQTYERFIFIVGEVWEEPDSSSAVGSQDTVTKEPRPWNDFTSYGNSVQNQSNGKLLRLRSRKDIF